MSRKRVRNIGPGIFPRKEAPRTDELYSEAERDSLYNHLLENGLSDYQFRSWVNAGTGRSLKAAHRQWEILLYAKEEETIVFSYVPGPSRKSRTGLKISCAEKALLKKHQADQVPIARTAICLARSAEDVAVWHLQNESNKPVVVTLTQTQKKAAPQCEGWRRHGGIFTLGLPVWEQCKNPGEVLLRFEDPDSKKVQTLPACKVCWSECISKGLKILSAVPIE